jgi:uncharacterized MAPEG superfamily protein
MPINAVDTTIIAIVAFSLWTVLLGVTVPVWRMFLLATRRARTSDFTPGDAHGSPLYWRFNRAHLNAVENLIVFAALGVSGIAAGVSDEMFGRLCLIVLFARYFQTVAHLISGSPPFLALRTFAFAIQVVCFVLMAGITLERIF